MHQKEMIMNNIKLKRIIFCAFLVVLFAACNTPKRLNKVMNKLPEAAAKECAVRFPIKETIDTVTIIDSAMIQAYEMEFVYLYSMLDSLLGNNVSDSVKREIVTVFQEKKVPVIKYKYITKIQESSAKCQVLLDSMQNIQTDLDGYIEGLTAEKEHYGKKYLEAKDNADKYKKQRNNSYWWILLLLIALFRKPLIKVANKLITKS
jgi:hypothetical protein